MLQIKRIDRGEGFYVFEIVGIARNERQLKMESRCSDDSIGQFDALISSNINALLNDGFCKGLFPELVQ